MGKRKRKRHIQAPVQNPDVEIWFDGAIRGNPGGKASCAIAVYVNGREVFQQARLVGEGPGMSNNVAEYAGVLFAMSWLQEQKVATARVYGDSQMVIRQMAGRVRARGRGVLYEPYNNAALDLLRELNTQVEFVWVPREQNVRCDRLAATVL